MARGKSPITGDPVAGGEVGLEQVRLDGDRCLLGSSAALRKAAEKSSYVVQADGAVTDVTPLSFNARTRVHEYGGGDYAVFNGTIVFF